MKVALAYAVWLFTFGLHPNDPSTCEPVSTKLANGKDLDDETHS